MLKPPNNVKKLRHFLRILACHVSEAWQNAGPSLKEKSVEKCQFVKQHLKMSMDHHDKGSQFIQTSRSLCDIYTASIKRLGVVITQDNWPIAFSVGTPRHAINKHNHRTRTLSQKSSAECCGNTNIRLYQPYLIRDGQVDTQKSTPLNDIF